MTPTKQLFIEKRISDSLKILPGTGTITIDIPFIPEYIKVKFLDPDRKNVLDTLTYDLIYTGDPTIPYQITINWSVTSGRTRRFKYTVAKLASFHNGVNK